VAVDHRAVAAGAAEELVDGQPGRLPLEIPQRHVDGGDGRHRDRPAPPIGAAVEELPDVLDPVRIAADQAGDDMVLEIGGDGHLAPVQRRVADARQPVLRLDLQRHEIAPGRADDDTGGADLRHGW
jgi:hypothetical protein